CSRRRTWRPCSSSAAPSIPLSASIPARCSPRRGCAATGRGCTGRTLASCREKRGARDARVDRRGRGAARAGRRQRVVRRRGDGGKVVKTVAGFALPKRMCGSCGTLAFSATATFRVHPVPESTVTLRARGGNPVEVVRRVRALQLEPTAMIALGEGTGWDVYL